MTNLTNPLHNSNTRREDPLSEWKIKYCLGLSRLLTWRLRYPLAEPDLTLKLRDFVEKELDFLITIKEEEKLIYV